MSRDLGNLLLVMAAVLAAVGLWLRLGAGWPPFGRLPGDIVIQRGSMTIWIPVTTMIVLSLILSLIARWWSRGP